MRTGIEAAVHQQWMVAHRNPGTRRSDPSGPGDLARAGQDGWSHSGSYRGGERIARPDGFDHAGQVRRRVSELAIVSAYAWPAAQQKAYVTGRVGLPLVSGWAWWTQHLLLSRRVPWRALLPGAVATALGMVESRRRRCGDSAPARPSAVRRSRQTLRVALSAAAAGAQRLVRPNKGDGQRWFASFGAEGSSVEDDADLSFQTQHHQKCRSLSS